MLKKSLKLPSLQIQSVQANNNNKNNYSWELPKANLQKKITDALITLVDTAWNRKDNLWTKKPIYSIRIQALILLDSPYYPCSLTVHSPSPECPAQHLALNSALILSLCSHLIHPVNGIKSWFQGQVRRLLIYNPKNLGYVLLLRTDILTTCFTALWRQMKWKYEIFPGRIMAF